jgi:hypothetical protein
MVQPHMALARHRLSPVIPGMGLSRHFASSTVALAPLRGLFGESMQAALQLLTCYLSHYTKLGSMNHMEK